ncbi:RNA polymerase sigma factor [Saccharibacillus deserti]|uniref:RNA polymerase sigma factor n=1 Tax=Saccharibacillus deserti TaxID=1634444 RepID=UPI0015542AC4|nr:RNA polymerase sigma factor [Saccharibacillus deserti]
MQQQDEKEKQKQNEKDLMPSIERVRNGETDAYGDIIAAFEKSIYLYALYLLRNRDEAEDAAQEIFIKAFRKIDQYQGGVFSSWLYKIAYHHCLDLLRKRKRIDKLLGRYILQKKQDLPAHSAYEDEIYEMLNALNGEERQILLLRALEEYSYKEIGEILDMNPVTARKKYARIRQKLLQKKEGTKNAKSAKLG